MIPFKKGVGLDLETTGLDQADGHRIIEIAMITYDLQTRQVLERYEQRIDPDRSVPTASIDVHGITYDMLVGCPKWEDVAPEIARRLAETEFFIAHNAAFDGPFLAGELQRVGLLPPGVKCYCTMENARWATPNGKLPRLEELCFALGVDYDRAKAHAATYDVERTMECLFRGMDRGFYSLENL